MAEFVPSKGFTNCPKCGGWQVLDKTVRSPNGWPTGPLLYVECDCCKGRGEIANAWPTQVPKLLVVVRGFDDVPLPECEHETTIERTILGQSAREEFCADCGELISLTEPQSQPTAWPMFTNKED
jgi:ssDNA-binding Zn-finger/Zn-ribbon topoisomerase 1